METVTNPNGDDLTEYELQQIKGPTIGETLYTQNFVLKTLMSLYEDDWSETKETDLCTLWDMTIDMDVVNFILDYDYINIIQTICNNHSDNNRLVEIVIGILGNLCASVKCVNLVCDGFMDTLVALLSTDDIETLGEVIRVLRLVLHAKPDRFFTEIESTSFMSCFIFILNNCTNRAVQIKAIDFVHAFVFHANALGIDENFVTDTFVRGVNECFADVSNDWDSGKLFSDYVAIVAVICQVSLSQEVILDCLRNVLSIVTRDVDDIEESIQAIRAYCTLKGGDLAEFVEKNFPGNV